MGRDTGHGARLRRDGAGEGGRHPHAWARLLHLAARPAHRPPSGAAGRGDPARHRPRSWRARSTPFLLPGAAPYRPARLHGAWVPPRPEAVPAPPAQPAGREADRGARRGGRLRIGRRPEPRGQRGDPPPQGSEGYRHRQRHRPRGFRWPDGGGGAVRPRLRRTGPPAEEPVLHDRDHGSLAHDRHPPSHDLRRRTGGGGAGARRREPGPRPDRAVRRAAPSRRSTRLPLGAALYPALALGGPADRADRGALLRPACHRLKDPRNGRGSDRRRQRMPDRAV